MSPTGGGRLAKRVERGNLSDDAASAILARITPTADVNDLAGVDAVIEAVFEKLEVKRAVFRELEGMVRPDAILATNTSSLSIDGIVQEARRRGILCQGRGSAANSAICYLLDITEQITGAEARFVMADAGSPTLVRDGADESALYVLMPMRV